MRLSSYLLVGLGGYLIFMIDGLPAQHILGWTASDSKKPPLTYGTIQGTLWRGKMEAVTIQGTPVDKLKWRFTPTSLLFGQIGFDIKINHSGEKLKGNVAKGTGNSYQLEDFKGKIPAAMLPPLIDLGQIGIGGMINLDLQNLTLEGQKIVSAEGTVKWLDASLRTPFAVNVGDLQAELLTDDNGQIKATIKDMGGATSVNGEFSLTSEGNFLVKGNIKPGKGSDPSIRSALKAISKSQADGSYKINYSANL
ncbi:MAG: type II secretion system protein N [Candidatus Thiodiazotropha sp.]|jgi:general secretion pathway protein N